MLVPLNITGATYKSRSLPLSNQVTRNFYPELVENQSAKSSFVLMPFPCLTLLGAATGINRGATFHAGTLFKVTGTTLYSVNASGTHTNIGFIPGAGRCIFAPIGSKLIIVTGGRAFEYDSGITEILDSDLETPDSAAHLNNQIIFDGDGGRFASSAVGDATDINALNYATAESDADNLSRVYVFEQLLFLFGDKTIERWFNSGIGRPPFDRVQGGIMQIGLAAVHSVSDNANSMYWLGSDNHVYRYSNQQYAPITPSAIADDIASYTAAEIQAATGFCFTAFAQNFYQLNLPDASWVFHEKSGQWFNSGEEGARHWADGYVNAFRKDLVIDYRNGNIYELGNTYTNNGEQVTRVRDTGPLHGEMVGAPGKEIEIDRFEVIMETGRGLNAGQGEDPELWLQVSPDGGKTWSTEMRAHIGREGEFLYKVEWGPLGTFDSCLFRIKVSDPVFVSIHSAAADVQVGI